MACRRSDDSRDDSRVHPLLAVALVAADGTIAARRNVNASCTLVTVDFDLAVPADFATCANWGVPASITAGGVALLNDAASPNAGAAAVLQYLTYGDAAALDGVQGCGLPPTQEGHLTTSDGTSLQLVG